MGRRIFCLCLCVLLLCSVLPMRIVSAEEPEQKREDALPEDARDSQGAEKANDDASGSAEPIGSSEANAVVGTSGDGIADETPSGGNADRPDADGVQGEDNADASGAPGEALGTEPPEEPTKEPDTQASDPNMSDPLPDAAPIDEQPNDTVSAPVPDEPSGEDFPNGESLSEEANAEASDAAEKEENTMVSDAGMNAAAEISDVGDESVSEESDDAAKSVKSAPTLRSAGYSAPHVESGTVFSRVSPDAVSDGAIVIFAGEYDGNYYVMGSETDGKGLKPLSAPSLANGGSFTYTDEPVAFFTVEKSGNTFRFLNAQDIYLLYFFNLSNYLKLQSISENSTSESNAWIWGNGYFSASVQDNPNNPQKIALKTRFYAVGITNSDAGTVYLYTVSSAAAPAAYTVTFDANGGDGAPSAIEVPEDEDCTIPDDVPVREGYTFLGWAESADAATVVYQPGDTYTGHASVTLYAVWQENVPEPTGPEAVFIGNTLVLDGTIGINFYVNVNGDPTGVTAALSDGSITKTYTVADAEYVEQYAGYRIPFRYIPAAEIDKKVTLRMYDANGNELSLKDENGYAVEASRCSYSVADWGINMRHKETETEATRQFAAALLNYGTYADAYFHNVELKANYLLEDMNEYVDRAQFDPVIPADAAEVGYLGATLLLQNDTAIRLYFSKSIKIPDADSGKYTVGHNDKGYYVEKPNIGATKLGHKYTFTIQYNEKTYSFQYAALSYANDRIRYGDDGIRNLCKALYAYYETACAYFAELQN